MNAKTIIVGLAILLLLLVFIISRQNGAQQTEKISLSPELCLAAEAGYRQLADDAPSHREYLRQYWADSTRQFFSKILVSPEGDTLFVSVFNNANLRTAQELLLHAGFETLRQETIPPVIKMLARSVDGSLFLRYLIDGGPFRSVTMADLPGQDSSRILQMFETNTFIKNIEPCL